MNALQPTEKIPIRFLILPDLHRGLSMTGEDVIKFVARELRVSDEEAGNRIVSDMTLDNRDFRVHDVIVAERSGVIAAMKYIDPVRRQQIALYFKPGMPVAITEPVKEDPARAAKTAAANVKRLETIKNNRASS